MKTLSEMVVEALFEWDFALASDDMTKITKAGSGLADALRDLRDWENSHHLPALATS